MMFSTALEKYKDSGSFTFKATDSLEAECNAPSDKGGIYLIFKNVAKDEILVYIGSSGQRTKDGTLKLRKGGMKARLVNGYHPNRFGEPTRLRRQRAFPKHMQAQNIGEIKIYWWVTYDENTTDFPTEVELALKKLYVKTFNKMPEWHQGNQRISSKKG